MPDPRHVARRSIDRIGSTAVTAGTDLTIEAGAFIVGASPADYMVVSRGNTLDVQGAKFNPVVMTSANDLEAILSGNPRPFETGINAEWGGLIINGRAPINACIDGSAQGGTVDCQKSGEGSSGLFGGGTPDDNSGTLRYLQLKYAGFRVNNADELNGIAFQGVGSDTTAEYLQVHNNQDDGIEMFGGTADLRYVVLTGIADDSLDYTDGWTGNAQFVLVRHAPDDSDQGFEFDNNGDENDALPRSNPVISNFTLIGQRASSASDFGMLLREGTAGTLVNGIVVDFNDACLDVDNSATFAQANSGALDIQSIFFDCPTTFEEDDLPTFSTTTFAAGDNNTIGTTSLEGFSFITDMANNNAKGVVPADGGPESLVTAVDPTTLGAFFSPAEYLGAVEDGNDDWFQGWTLQQQ